MNHNGVISLPVKASEVLAAGDVVTLHSDGSVKASTGGAVTNGPLGVVLHDVSQAATGTPAAIHLFNSGGIFNINVLTNAGAATRGTAHNLGAKGLAATAGNFASGTMRFIPLETTAVGGMIQAIYIGA
jgi:hypothetical protein